MKKLMIIVSLSFVSTTVWGMKASPLLNNNSTVKARKSANNLYLLAETALKGECIDDLNNGCQKNSKENSTLNNFSTKKQMNSSETFVSLLKQADLFFVGALNQNQVIQFVQYLINEITYLNEYQGVYENAINRLNEQIKKSQQTIQELKKERQILFQDCKIQSQHVEMLSEEKTVYQWQIIQLEETITKLKNHNENLQKANENLKRKNKNVTKDNNDLKEKNKKLKLLNKTQSIQDN